MIITEKQLKALTDANKKKSTGVYQFDFKTGKFIAEYGSIREAERQTGVQNNNICLVCRGEKRQAGGFIWMPKHLYEGNEENECTIERTMYE